MSCFMKSTNCLCKKRYVCQIVQNRTCFTLICRSVSTSPALHNLKVHLSTLNNSPSLIFVQATFSSPLHVHKTSSCQLRSHLLYTVSIKQTKHKVYIYMCIYGYANVLYGPHIPFVFSIAIPFLVFFRSISSLYIAHNSPSSQQQLIR